MLSSSPLTYESLHDHRSRFRICVVLSISDTCHWSINSVHSVQAGWYAVITTMEHSRTFIMHRFTTSYCLTGKAKFAYLNGIPLLHRYAVDCRHLHHHHQKQKARIMKDAVQLVLNRHQKLCNFIEWKSMRIIYRRCVYSSITIIIPRYASLYFAICIDEDDNELLALEVIHQYVEVLDRYFGNVCTVPW